MAAGRVTDDMGSDEVFRIHKESLEFAGIEKGGTFKRRLNLREIVNRHKGRALEDLDALKIALHNCKHDVPEVNHRGEPQHNGSEIQKHLMADIKDNKHLGRTPMAFRQTRPCHQLLDPNTFRCKGQQEVRTIKHLHTLKCRADEKLKETL